MTIGIDADGPIGRSIDMTPTPAAMRHMTAALQEQIERSRVQITSAETMQADIEHGGVESYQSPANPGIFCFTLFTVAENPDQLIRQALEALIEREEARIARIESGLADLS